ncbi:FHA domain-containing protein [Streptomyces sp. NPDC093060]|uniref:FHA domain-containing protein n=1 Tax=Streptomyces sp. NPDC093060 TaxID=3366019 RepID=UPI00382ACC40
MTEASDFDDDDWDSVDQFAPPPPPPPTPVGTKCGRCDAIVPVGTAACPRCRTPVGSGRSSPRIPGRAVRLVFRGGRHLDVPRGSEIRLGRSSSWAPEASELLADEDTVSAQHATLDHASDGTAWLTEVPQGATNGTRVNDSVLVPGSRVRLRDGDRVELGPGVEFIVRGIAEEPREAAS